MNKIHLICIIVVVAVVDVKFSAYYFMQQYYYCNGNLIKYKNDANII